MIQIVCSSCTQRKLRAERVPFYTDKRFYDNINMVFVATCPRHHYFKERTGSRFENLSCNCLNLQKGRCSNCKIICFNINFLAEKIKLGHYLMYRQRWTLYQLKHTSKKWTACCFLFLPRMFQGTTFIRSTEIYFLDEKKNPRWIWHEPFFSNEKYV